MSHISQYQIDEEISKKKKEFDDYINSLDPNKIKNLKTNNDFAEYINSLEQKGIMNYEIKTLFGRTFMKKNNNPDLIENNKQRLRDDLKNIVNEKKKNIEDEKKRIIDEEKQTEKKRQQAKKEIIDLNLNLIKNKDDNNNDLLDPIPGKNNITKYTLSKNLSNRILPPISILNKKHTDNILPSSDELKFQQENYEKMKEKERELKKRMEKLADKIGKMHTYSTIGKMKTVQKYHPFYNELMDIEKHIHNIDKQEKRIQELEEKMGNISVDKSKNQEIIKSYEKGNSILKKNIAVLEQKIAHLEEKIEHSPKTMGIIKTRTLRKTTRPLSRRTRSSQNLSPNTERKLLARHGIRDNKVYPYPLMPNDASKKWVNDDPNRKKGPFTNARKPYKAGKRTQKKHRK